MKVSGCCQARVINDDICADCKEHCDAIEIDEPQHRYVIEVGEGREPTGSYQDKFIAAKTASTIAMRRGCKSYVIDTRARRGAAATWEFDEAGNSKILNFG